MIRERFLVLFWTVLRVPVELLDRVLRWAFRLDRRSDA
jgi:hypothetical protein